MSEIRPLVLVVEDDVQVRRLLRTTLGAHGYQVLEAERGEEAATLAAQHLPAIVVLDLGLPDVDGIEVVRRLRDWCKTPIIILSARGAEPQKVAALDAGADDYLTKPFGVAELLARLRAALRRAADAEREPAPSRFVAGPLEVDLAARLVKIEGTELHLTPIEYKLLATLVKYAGKVVTHQQLIREVWGPAIGDQSQALRVHMTHLRRKIGTGPGRARLISTETGVGYRLRDPVS